MLTVYGIETYIQLYLSYLCFPVATVLTVYGIETLLMSLCLRMLLLVATVLTVYGIETGNILEKLYQMWQLQQCLPFTVLKPQLLQYRNCCTCRLQQHLPFTVLKQEPQKRFRGGADRCNSPLPFTVLKRVLLRIVFRCS